MKKKVDGKKTYLVCAAMALLAVLVLTGKLELTVEQLLAIFGLLGAVGQAGQRHATAKAANGVADVGSGS